MPVRPRKPPAISIHSPHTGRDAREAAQQAQSGNFNPLSPHGERLCHGWEAAAEVLFQSTLPTRGETRQPRAFSQPAQFQSTLPTRGETPVPQLLTATLPFQSTLPTRGETFLSEVICDDNGFQSTLPAWGETRCFWYTGYNNRISIHSPRMGRDPEPCRVYKLAVGFQSTLPAWGETAIGSPVRG